MFALLVAVALQDAPIVMSTVDMATIVDVCAKPDSLKLDTCNSYILGVADTLQLSGKTCVPSSGIATQQMIRVARKYIADHPERWATHPAFIIREALVASFPCRKLR